MQSERSKARYYWCHKKGAVRISVLHQFSLMLKPGVSELVHRLNESQGEEVGMETVTLKWK